MSKLKHRLAKLERRQDEISTRQKQAVFFFAEHVEAYEQGREPADEFEAKQFPLIADAKRKGRPIMLVVVNHPIDEP